MNKEKIKEILVPTLGESVSEATIAKWHKKEQDYIKTDELILELETEKVTLEVNSLHSGRLTKINFSEGDNVKIGDILGLIDISEISETNEVNKMNESESVKEEDNKISNIQKIFNTSNEEKEDRNSKLELASPSARKMIIENNIDINLIKPSGRDGRITKEDVIKTKNSSNRLENLNSPKENLNQTKIEERKEVASNIDHKENSEREERVKMSPLRKTIAKRLKDSQNRAAILTSFNEINMKSVIAMREKYKDIFVKKYDVKLGFMSFFVKAAVLALKSIPSVNTEIDGDYIIYKKYHDIGVAVSTDQGLVVPVVRDADQLSFGDIEQEIVNLAGKARASKLSISDMQGGCFTITNGGIYGSMLSTPIINPPQTGILGLHNIVKRPCVDENDQIVIRPMMYVALSYDHRIIDGKEAVLFLVKIKEAIENPERLMLEI